MLNKSNTDEGIFEVNSEGEAEQRLPFMAQERGVTRTTFKFGQCCTDRPSSNH